MSSTYTVPEGTADGSLLTVSDAAVLRSSTIVGTLADGPDAGLSTVEIVAQADGSFVLAARTLEAGDSTSDDVVFTYTVRDTDFDASGTLALKNVTAAGALRVGAPEIALITGATQVLDITTYVGFHYDVLHDCTLSLSGYAREGQLYTVVLDGSPSDPHTVTFGSGFFAPPASLVVPKGGVLRLLFVGHDLEFQLCQQPGTPTVYGPYVANYTDFPGDGDMLTLWTPAAGDVLLALKPDRDSAAAFDTSAGVFRVGQDTATSGNSFWGLEFADLQTLDGVLAQHQWQVLSSATPVRVRYVANGDDPLESGHVELYALVARAVTS